MKKLGRSLYKVPDGDYTVMDGFVYKWEPKDHKILGRLDYNLSVVPCATDDELQHVGYDDEQCGRTK